MPVKKTVRSKPNLQDHGVRATRQSKDRAKSQDRELTDEQRLTEFRIKNFQSVLPTIPEIKGFHVCWLTTENSQDPIHARMRLGYEPVRLEDVPGWGEQLTLKSGDWAGCISINEMIAFKLPLHLYHAYMTEVHYTQPNAEEEALSMATKEVEEEASALARKPISFELEDGQKEIGDFMPEPTLDSWGG